MRYIETRYLGTDGKIHTENIPCGNSPEEYRMSSDALEDVPEPTRNEVRTTSPVKREKISIIPKKKK